MLRKYVLGPVTAAAIALALGTPSHAQPADPFYGRPTVDVGNWYGGLEAGAILIHDIGFHVRNRPSFRSFQHSEGGSYDAGLSVGPFVGYHFNDYLAAEADFFYSHASYELNTAENYISISGPPVALESSTRGHTDAESFLANVVVTPFGRSRFSPYLGGGIGFTNLDNSTRSSTGTASVPTLGLTAPFRVAGGTHSELDLATNAVIGLDWAATPRLSFGARYRYLWVDLAEPSCPSFFKCSQDNLSADILSATLRYRF